MEEKKIVISRKIASIVMLIATVLYVLSIWDIIEIPAYVKVALLITMAVCFFGMAFSKCKKEA